MAFREYTPADHERAFNIWFQRSSLTAVSKEMGLEFYTVKNWAGPFACRYSCPWHNWEKLRRERAAALGAQMQVLQTGNPNPIAMDAAIRDAVAGVPETGYLESPTPPSNEERMQAIAALTRSDIERITHWEFLYSKVFYHLTGLTLDSRLLVRDNQPVSAEELQQKLGEGEKLKSFEGGVKMMQLIQMQIDALKGKVGAYDNKVTTTDEGELVRVEETKASPEVIKPVNIEHLRQLRARWESTDPETRELLKSMLGNELELMHNLSSVTDHSHDDSGPIFEPAIPEPLVPTMPALPAPPPPLPPIPGATA